MVQNAEFFLINSKKFLLLIKCNYYYVMIIADNWKVKFWRLIYNFYCDVIYKLWGRLFLLISKNSSGTYSAQFKLKFWAILWIIIFFFSKDESTFLIFQQQQPKKLSKKTKQVFGHFCVALTFAFYILVLIPIINFRQFCLTPFSAFS